MIDNSATSVELQNPSAAQINSAEVLIEESLEPVAESDLSIEIAPEEISVEIEEATVVDTTELISDLSSNVDSEDVPETLVQEVSEIDASQIVSDTREEAIESFETDATPSLDVDSLTAVEGDIAADVAPSVSSVFSEGTANSDLLFGTPDDDFLLGGEGDDIVIALPGRDLVFGEAGNDFLVGGAGDDVVDGGTGNDLITGDDSRTAPGDGGADLIRGGDGLDVIFAGGSNDTVFGENDDDVMYGEAGNDALNGGAGIDLLDGGDGDDRLFGDSGNDLLNGGTGNDSLNAEDGDDLAIGGSGNDAIFGGRGNDTIAGVDISADNPGFEEIDTLQGGEGSDVFQLGDAEDFYYDDGQTLSIGSVPTGTGDYGLIEDFAAGDDLIQLNGFADQYVLQSTQDDPFNQNNLPSGTAIYRLTGIIAETEDSVNLGSTDSLEPIPTEQDALIELVGVVENVDPSGLSLTDSSQFTFV